MRKSRLVETAVCLLLGMALLQGCAIFIPIGIGAAGAAGAVSYVGNELRVKHEVSLDKAWDAANGAIKDLQYTIEPKGTRKDAADGVLRARTPQKQQVYIRVIRERADLTEIRIRVGFWTTQKNGVAADVVYEKMRARL